MAQDVHCGCEDERKEWKFADSAPYPPINICGQNRTYGRMMLDNMGGQISEMSDLTLYFYNNLLIVGNEDISRCFLGIAIVEMHHLKIFGEISRRLGENPRLWSCKQNQMQYWSPSFNEYPMEFAPLLINAMNHEKAAINKYREQCRIIKDSGITDCIKRILSDEKLHLQIFEWMYNKYCS